MVDGEAITRVWNALWWAQNPFFITPKMSHPLYFYFMGPLLYLTGEIYYTPLITVIALVTLGGIFLAKISLLITDFKTSLLTYVVFMFTPAIFRLNYDPYPYTIAPVLYVIAVYYLLKAILTPESKKYFMISGIFSFLAIFNRPESLFVIICFCFIAFFSKTTGRIGFIILSLWFQIFWILLSLYLFGKPTATYDTAAEFPNIFDIQGLSLLIRLKGLFLPYYFWVLGMTFVLFYFLIKGLLISYRKFPPVILIILFVPIIVPALANGAAAMRATIFNSTFYIYSMFYFSCIFSAIGLRDFINRFQSVTLQTALASAIIITAIPLSYIKDVVPEKYKNLFPKIIQFFETAPEPNEVRKMCEVVDKYIDSYPSLILDIEDAPETIVEYIAYRTKLAPPKYILMTNYNVPKDLVEFRSRIKDFVSNNRKGLIISRIGNTKLHDILKDTNTTSSWNFEMERVEKTEHWSAYTYKIE
jgi:hypothetical protein